METSLGVRNAGKLRHMTDEWQNRDHTAKSLQTLRTQVPGLVETSPGVRSVMVEYEPRTLPLAKLLEVLQSTEAGLPPSDAVSLPSRVLRLPIAFGERWTKAAIQR